MENEGDRGMPAVARDRHTYKQSEHSRMLPKGRLLVWPPFPSPSLTLPLSAGLPVCWGEIGDS